MGRALAAVPRQMAMEGGIFMMKVQAEAAEGMKSQSIGAVNMKTADSYSRDLQTQITALQGQLQGVSGDQELSQEEKVEKRQEITAKIFELKQQLRQHQKEEKESADKEGQKIVGQPAVTGTSSEEEEGSQAGLSETAVQAMVAADSAVTASRSAGDLISRTEGRLSVVEGELEQDAQRSRNVKGKRAEKEELERRLEQIYERQTQHIGEARKNIALIGAETERNEKTAGKKTETEPQREIPPKGFGIAGDGLLTEKESQDQEAYRRFQAVGYFANVNITV